MDPQLKSILTSVAMAAATSIAAWAVGHGIIPGSEAGDLSNWLVTGLFGAITAGLAYYKQRQQAKDAMTTALTATKEGQTAMIGAINNSTNGVKVVDSATSPSPPVTAPTRFVPPTA